MQTKKRNPKKEVLTFINGFVRWIVILTVVVYISTWMVYFNLSILGRLISYEYRVDIDFPRIFGLIHSDLLTDESETVISAKVTTQSLKQEKIVQLSKRKSSGGLSNLDPTIAPPINRQKDPNEYELYNNIAYSYQSSLSFAVVTIMLYIVTFIEVLIIFAILIAFLHKYSIKYKLTIYARLGIILFVLIALAGIHFHTYSGLRQTNNFNQNDLLSIRSLLRYVQSEEDFRDNKPKDITEELEKIFKILPNAWSYENFTIYAYLYNQETRTGYDLLAHSKPVKSFYLDLIKEGEVNLGKFSQPFDCMIYYKDDQSKNGKRIFVYGSETNPEWLAIAVLPDIYEIDTSNQQRRQPLYVVLNLIFALGAVLISISVRNIIDKRLKLVTDGFEQLKRGNFKLNLQSKIKDEIGDLMQNLNETANKLEEKRRIEGIFGRLVSNAVAEYYIKHKEGLAMDGESKRITILYVDIVNFTTISEQAQPDKLVLALNLLFGHLTSKLLENQATVDKFIGDAILAYWNAPLDYAGHPERAIKAGLQLLELKDQINSELDSKGLPLMAYRVAIHTDTVIAGPIGVPERFEYTIIGDGVNLCQRLCTMTSTYELSVTEATIAEIDQRLFQFGPELSERVKGRVKEVAIRRVLGINLLSEAAERTTSQSSGSKPQEDN